MYRLVSCTDVTGNGCPSLLDEVSCVTVDVLRRSLALRKLVPRADATCADCLSLLLDEVLFVDDTVDVLSLPDNRSRALRKLTSRPIDDLGDDIVVIELLPLVSIPCTPLTISCLSSSVDGAESVAMTDLSMVILVTPIVFVVVELRRLVST